MHHQLELHRSLGLVFAHVVDKPFQVAQRLTTASELAEKIKNQQRRLADWAGWWSVVTCQSGSAAA